MINGQQIKQNRLPNEFQRINYRVVFSQFWLEKSRFLIEYEDGLFTGNVSMEQGR